MVLICLIRDADRWTFASITDEERALPADYSLAQHHRLRITQLTPARNLSATIRKYCALVACHLRYVLGTTCSTRPNISQSSAELGYDRLVMMASLRLSLTFGQLRAHGLTSLGPTRLVIALSCSKTFVSSTLDWSYLYGMLTQCGVKS